MEEEGRGPEERKDATKEGQLVQTHSEHDRFLSVKDSKEVKEHLLMMKEFKKQLFLKKRTRRKKKKKKRTMILMR